MQCTYIHTYIHMYVQTFWPTNHSVIIYHSSKPN